MKTTKINVLLWVAQGFVALILIWASYAKLLQPLEETAKMLPWAEQNPGLLKITGTVDLLGGLGLILPALLRIRPKLTILAAYGVVALMVCGIVFHLMRDEGSLIGMNMVVLLLALFIAWGRSTRAPIAGRSEGPLVTA